MESKKQPTILLAATLWWPLSARLALRLFAHGCRVVAVCPRGHMLRHVTGLEQVYPYRSLNSLGSLEASIRAARPDLIVPCDDRVAWQLHELHQRRPDLRSLIEASLGPGTGYGVMSRRERLLETAAALSIRVPETQCIASEGELRAWWARVPSPAVLKLDGTWGGEGIEIVESEVQAIAAFRKLSRRPGLGTACKRLLVNRDPLAFWAWRKRTVPSITIQRLIAGRPANAMLACWRGELLGMLAVEALSTQGATGAAIVVRVIENVEISKAAQLLTERLSLTGFYGLDFVLEPETASAYFIEMNPRCTQLGHLALTKRGDLAGILCAKLTGQSEPSPQAWIDNRVVAFFPQAIVWTPKSSLIRTGYHDVPWEDPNLVRELLREIWPDRQWSARLYHHFRPPRKVSAREFEPPQSVPTV